ncbi:Dynamin family protein [Caldicellulosiruptor owensensis OL]|uniref:Dynamin family protein n=1 Tax=Caldicellulosiruptor owensensis (strain ATCC 700167 / DSM 13100 / OL) TaxID=632518 RepID=E4Q5Q4_CALOW|nr:dynamin family protein [Caldicellulosiruptor owensensis]ADQ05463.1 Dynamin family protein [Caldicellulosiruptor owensensis OL]
MRNMTYDVMQENIKKYTSRVKEISDKIDSESIKKLAKSIEEKIEKDAFYLVVLGQFKRGKSTLINYMLGTDLLPTGVLPLTSTITKIYYSPEVKVDVIFKNGMKKEILSQDLYLYCTEKGNPENQKGVDTIEIGYPFDFLNKDVVIVDTPGIGSVYQHNTDVTYEFVDRADAVIFVLSVDPPITEVEKKFLQRISESVDKIFFVINKCDLTGKNELEEIIRFTINVIKDITKKASINIFPVSAKMALEGRLSNSKDILKKSDIKVFEEHLRKFLQEEKEKVQILSNLKSLDNFLEVCRTFLENEIKLKIMPLSQLEENIERFDKFLKKINQSKLEIYKLFKVEMNDILTVFDDKMEGTKKELITSITKKIKNYYPSVAKLKRKKQKEYLEKYLEEIIVQEFEFLKKEVERYVEEKYSALLSRYCAKINDLIKSIKDTAKDLFSIEIGYYEGMQGFVAKSKFTYKIGYEVGALEIDPVYFSYLLPGKLAQRIILKRVLDRIEIDADRNIGRIRYDLLRRMEESFEAFKSDMEDRVSQVCSLISELLSNTMEDLRKNKSELEIKIAFNQEVLSEIKKIKKEIIEIISEAAE